MTSHPNRVFIIVPKAKEAEANAAMVTALGNDAQPDDDKTFTAGAGMSPSGSPNATHPCCCMVLTDDQLANVQSEFANVPGARIDIEDERIYGAANRALIAAQNGSGLKLVRGEI